MRFRAQSIPVLQYGSRHMLSDFSGNLVHVRYLSLLEDINTIRTYRWVVHGSFGGCTTDRESLSLTIDLGMVAYTSILRPQLITDVQTCTGSILGGMTTLTGGQHASHVEAWLQWRLRVKDGPALAAETSMLQEVDDMASVVIQQPPTKLHRWPCSRRTCRRLFRGAWSLSAVLWAALHHSTISNRRSLYNHRVAVPGSIYRTGSARGVKMGARRWPGRGAGGRRPPVPPFPNRHEHVDPGHVEVERGEGSGAGQPIINPFDSPNLDIPSFSLGLTPTSQSFPSRFGTLQMPPPFDLGFASFQSPQSTSFGFRAPPPPGTAGLSTPHQPILQASSSDKEERMDDMDGIHHYGFGHHVGKKTTRFTPSDWP
ncbi:hypothetical protein M9H77_03883 [Catharanthus roseus]|uniref:Uncharacterized protein n=1 Tax=Catharanthus roseus TaxID=4058 RepID=A0ACC0CCJ3_CATRO|nr:hypothetical protein M9H77_03883 [Catharanthus roseus]